MNIEIISCACHELGNTRVFEKLKNRDRNLKHIIIAPDRSLFSIERRLFDELGEDCFFDLDVMSITRLSKRLLSTIKSPNILTKQSGIALVKKLLVENRENLLSFGKSVDYMGFATELFETICLYKSCNILPNDVYTDDSQSYANLKQKDIKLIYTEYESYLQSDFTDSFNQLRVFANSITEDFCKDTVFYFVEFDDFTALVYDIILKLARFSAGLYISCCYSNANNSNIYTNKVYGDLVTLFKQNGLNYSIAKTNNFGDNEKDCLLHNALSFKPDIFGKTLDKISISSFETMRDEVKYVIASIYSDVLAGRGTFSDYCIVVPSFNDYLSTIKREIQLYNIPTYFDKSDLLIDHVLIRSLFDICRLISGDFQLSDFVSVLKSPLLNFDNAKILDIDITLKRVGDIGAGLFNLHYDDDDISEFIDIIKKCRTYISNDNTYLNFYTQVISVIVDYIRLRSNIYLEKLDDIQTRFYTQVINKLKSIDNDFLSVFAMNLDSFGRFIEIYRSYFESSNLSLPPITSNTLLIADFNTSYIGRMPYLYVLGCNEGKLPKFQLDNGLVTDEEIATLPNGTKINPTISLLNKRKTFKMFDMLFRFKEHLYLSYTQTGSDGKLFANQLINSIKKIEDYDGVDNLSYDLDAVAKSYRKIDIDNVVFNNLTYKIAQNHLIDYSRDWQVYHESEAYRQIVSSLYALGSDSAELLNDNNSKVDLRLSNIQMFRNNMTSVSQVECYYTCPYKHFVRYGLRLKDNFGDTLQPNDIGTIIHEVLRYVVPFIVQGEDVSIVCVRAEKHLSQVLLNDEYKQLMNNPKNAYIVKSLKKECKRICRAICDEVKYSNFKPAQYEYKFGRDDFVLEGIGVKGSIDRVDINNNDFVIIDYKTGDNHFDNYNDVYSGKKLQLLVYAKAYANKTGKSNIGAFYMPISNAFGDENDGYRLRGVMVNDRGHFIDMDTRLMQDGYKSNVINLKTTSKGEIYSSKFYRKMCLSVDDYHYLIDFAVEKVRQAIINIKNGEIGPNPLKDKYNNNFTACKYCQYLGLCGHKGNYYNYVRDIGDIDELKEKADGGI